MVGSGSGTGTSTTALLSCTSVTAVWAHGDTKRGHASASLHCSLYKHESLSMKCLPPVVSSIVTVFPCPASCSAQLGTSHRAHVTLGTSSLYSSTSSMVDGGWQPRSRICMSAKLLASDSWLWDWEAFCQNVQEERKAHR